MKNQLNIDEILENISKIRDTGEKLLYLRTVHKDYEALSTDEKDKTAQYLRDKAALLHQQVEEILAK